MDDKYAPLWQKVSTALKPQVSSDTYKRWFSAIRLVDANDESLTFLVPNNIYQFWIESNHMPALQAAIVSSLDSPRTVKFAVPSEAGNDDSRGAINAYRDQRTRTRKSPGGAQRRQRSRIKPPQHFRFRVR